jgi:hypothetical protein
MPYLRMRTDLDGSPAQVAETLHSFGAGTAPQFIVCRSILKSPSWYLQVQEEVRKRAGDSIQIVDMYTLMWLVREYETSGDRHADIRFASAQVVTGQPGSNGGVVPVHLPDGPFKVVPHQGTSAWLIPQHAPSYYLYFDVHESFKPSPGTPLEVQLDFWDQGAGQLLLEYDATDAKAPHGGAYKPHPDQVRLTGSERWRTASFPIADARFTGGQNGEADFRFYNGGESLLVRAVRIQRKSSQ